jgi:hypothetical protein
LTSRMAGAKLDTVFDMTNTLIGGAANGKAAA